MNEKMPTLQAANGMSGNNKPCVAYGVTTKGNGDAFVSEERHTSLCTALYGTGGNNQPLVVLMDAYQHHGWRENEICGTLTAGQSNTVRGDTPLVICLQGNGIDRADTAGCNGKGWTEDVSYTLNTIDRPAVVYSFDSLSSNSMKSSNPNSGCREVEVAKCLDTTIPDPSKNQGGIAIVYPKVAGTLDANYYKGPGERNGIERDVVVYPKKTGTLMANSHPGSYCGQDAYNDMFVVENRGGTK